MKTKILLWSVVTILSVGIADDAAQRSQDRPQIITLSDGTKLTLLGTTFGNDQMSPKYGYFPDGTWNNGATNTTVVWVEAEHNLKRRPSYELLVSDQADTACVPVEIKTSSHVKEGVDVQAFVLKVFPRRDKNTILRARPYGGNVSKEHFVVSNPPSGSFPKWKAESLPSTRSNGDLVVTLKNYSLGGPSPRHRKSDAPQSDSVDQCVRLDFDVTQNERAATNWRPWLVETSDATGNRVRDVIYKYPQNGIMENLWDEQNAGFFYKTGLWPSEPAWKVRLEFTRTSGFDDAEILTLTNIPVRLGTEEEWEAQWSWEPPAVEPGETNSFVPDYTVNGIQLKFFPPLLRSSKSQPDEKFLTIVMRPNSNPELAGMRMTLIQATDEQGCELYTPFTPHTGYNCSIEFPDPKRDIKSMNLKLALHKSRHVEFTIKPKKP